MRLIGKTALGLIALLIVLFVVASIAYSPTYVARYIFWNVSDIKDYERFPSHRIDNAPPTFVFPTEPKEAELRKMVASCEYELRGRTRTIGDLDRFLAGHNTTAFIVIKDNKIIYERYFNGYARDSINTSFSMAKSVTSALTGIAIDNGLIGSVNDPIVKYLPELKYRGLDTITIRNLLMMNSGLKYVEGGVIWADDPMDYYYPDLRELALRKAIVQERPGVHFHYSNYSPQYIGMILKRVTKMSPSQYLQEEIWKKIGMEFGASWSTDSTKGDFERMGSTINARSIDFAKFGALFLKKGLWEGKRIISEKWVIESTAPEDTPSADYYTGVKSWSNDVFADPAAYYKYYWWGYRNQDGTYDYYAWGHLGQVIYISPSRNLVIVRNGSSEGGIYNWGTVCRAIAGRL